MGWVHEDERARPLSGDEHLLPFCFAGGNLTENYMDEELVIAGEYGVATIHPASSLFTHDEALRCWARYREHAPPNTAQSPVSLPVPPY